MDTGRAIAEILAGSWRQTPPRLENTPSLTPAISKVLLRTGAASLAWRRLSMCGFADCAGGARLKQAYRLNILEAAMHEQETATTFRHLHSFRKQPILSKGWAIARHYPERGLRPFGDIDLLVAPDEFDRVRAHLLDPSVPPLPVDLHRGCPDLEKDRTFDQLYKNSRTVELHGVAIRTLAPEDHLRLLCIHLLRHGAFRPLWLCDIALLMETLPEDFDWPYFLSGDPRRTDWVACTMGLAHTLLGAGLGDWPVRPRAKKPPGWLIPALLKQWSAGEFYIIDTSPLGAYRLQPAQMWRAVRLRWPNPIHATVELGASFNELPRMPYQVADVIRRAFLLAARTVRLAHGRSTLPDQRNLKKESHQRL